MTDNRPRNDAAMADILSSIRRIVAEDERRAPPAGAAPEDILELTVEMRVPEDAPSEPSAREAFEMSGDEAMVADVARAVIRDELRGALGRELQQQVRDLVRIEVSRALAESRGARD